MGCRRLTRHRLQLPRNRGPIPAESSPWLGEPGPRLPDLTPVRARQHPPLGARRDPDRPGDRMARFRDDWLGVVGHRGGCEAG
jgi:hypothetical protein